MADMEWPDKGTAEWEELVKIFDELIGYRVAYMIEYIGKGHHCVTRKDLTDFNRAFLEHLQSGLYRDVPKFEYCGRHFAARAGECEEILQELEAEQFRAKLFKARLHNVAWLAIDHGIRDMEALGDAEYVLYLTDFSDMEHLKDYVFRKPVVVTCLYEALGKTYNRLQIGDGYVMDDPQDVWDMVETLSDTFKSLSDAYDIFNRVEMNYDYVDPSD